MNVSREEWARLLDAVEGQAPGQVGLALADARDVTEATAHEAVEAAIETGPLAFEPDRGITGSVVLEDAPDEDAAEGPADPIEALVAASEIVASTDDATAVVDAAPATVLDADAATEPADGADATDPGAAALTDALKWYHEQLDRSLPEAAEYDTPRDYYREGRGWSDATIDAKWLGYAPANAKNDLVAYLFDRGHDREALLASGLFGERDDGNLYATWSGRYVLPYLDADGRPVYAISRALDPVHPADWKGHKYDKLPVSRAAVTVEEPIYGLDTVQGADSVLITEGIADAITAHQAGYPCLSPVTTQFKKSDRTALLDALDGRDVGRVYLIQDAERPTSDVVETPDGGERLSVEQFGEGVRGAVRTAAFLTEHGVDARVADLPRPGLDKVDLDDYIQGWSEALTPVLAAAKPVEEHPAYDDGTARDVAREAAAESTPSGFSGDGSSGAGSALFDLTIPDVTGLAPGFRGTNPLGHHGESEDYFVVSEGDEPAYDHKYKVAYNALTYLLVEAGERPADQPNGRLNDDEVLAAWLQAHDLGLLPADDPIPRKALAAVARDATEWGGEMVEHTTADGETFDGLPRDVYNAALEAVEERHSVDPGREPLGDGDGDFSAYATADAGRIPHIETCAPPAVDRRTDGVEESREEIRRVTREGLGSDDLIVLAHNAGIGKTTTVPRVLADEEEPHVVLLPSHENCTEFQADPAKPDGYFHLKGAGQPEHAECMTAKVDGEECPTHGAEACPTMCPVYSEADDDLRERFDALAATAGVRAAHRILDLWNRPWHGDECAWEAQFQAIESEDRVVTVHNYATLKSVREHGTVLVDDLQGFFEDEGWLTTTDLHAAGAVFADLATRRDGDEGDVLGELAEFANALAEGAGGGTLGTVDLGTLDAPDLEVVRTRTVPEDEGVPGHLDVIETAEATYKDYIDDNSRNYRKAPGIEVTYREDPAEVLSTAARGYYDEVRDYYAEGTEQGEPLDLTGFFAALAEAGVEEEACRVAAQQPLLLDTCPWCASDVTAREGHRVCSECQWTEESGRFAMTGAEPARVTVWPHTEPSGVADGIAWEALPATEDLPAPSDVLLLDATPRKRLYAGLWGIDVEAVDMYGHEPYALPNATVVQAADGQYHRSSLTDREPTRKRVQNAIDRVAEVHDSVLYVCAQKAEHALSLPDDAEVMHYGALRGLNRDEFDAIVCVGALHPPEDEIRRTADLLAQDHPRLRAGGAEYSTRQGAPNPPLWRKYDYTDDEGRGRAVATKGYSGLTGDLFQSVREDELEQAVHRLRPILADADEEKHIYLLTNVPTRVPVDHLTTIAGLTDPLKASLGVSDTATTLLEAMCSPDGDVSADGGTVEGTSAEWQAATDGLDVTDRSIRRALKALRDAGYVEKTGEYSSEGSPIYRATADAVAAVTANWRSLL